MAKNCLVCLEKNITTIEQFSNTACDKCSIKSIAFNRYAASNIPLSYWHLEMKDFKGSKDLLDMYENVIKDLPRAYKYGLSCCVSGTHGVGKTTTVVNILKKAAHKNYSCLYTTLTDIINSLIDSPNEEKFLARKELTSVDFLVIDEFDSRHMGNSTMSTDLFGKTFEHVFRTRTQNKMPVIMCSNSPNIVEAFTGPIKQSIESLMSGIKIFTVLGKDFRKELK